MNYLSQTHLAEKYDISRSTAYRICKAMRDKGTGVRLISGQFRYAESTFVKVSNERRGNEA